MGTVTGLAYHVVIAAERRVSTPEKPRELANLVKGQLHMTDATAGDPTDSNQIFIASWDLKSPWIVILKAGIAIADLTDVPGGWPMVDQATWEAANPPPSTP